MVSELNAAKQLIIRCFGIVIENLMHISGLIKYGKKIIYRLFMLINNNFLKQYSVNSAFFFINFSFRFYS
jgi:hypothetical protein